MSEVLLREARPSDDVAIAAIHVPDLPDDVEGEILVAAIIPCGAVVWVAEVEGEVVGYLALDGCTVERLYVATEHQGRGIGTLSLDKAKTLHPDGLRLYTFQRCLRARAFYEARGLLPIAFTDGADNKEREPDVLYAWYGAA